MIRGQRLKLRWPFNFQQEEVKMGEAKRRGSFEERKAQALKAGRKKVPTISRSRMARTVSESFQEQVIRMLTAGLLDRAHRRRLGLR